MWCRLSPVTGMTKTKTSSYDGSQENKTHIWWIYASSMSEVKPAGTETARFSRTARTDDTHLRRSIGIPEDAVSLGKGGKRRQGGDGHIRHRAAVRGVSTGAKIGILGKKQTEKCQNVNLWTCVTEKWFLWSLTLHESLPKSLEWQNSECACVWCDVVAHTPGWSELSAWLGCKDWSCFQSPASSGSGWADRQPKAPWLSLIPGAPSKT